MRRGGDGRGGAGKSGRRLRKQTKTGGTPHLGEISNFLNGSNRKIGEKRVKCLVDEFETRWKIQQTSSTVRLLLDLVLELLLEHAIFLHFPRAPPI